MTATLAGRYVIQRELGRGRMATVYLAEDEKLHRLVALKVLRPDLGAALGTERFLREIAIAARLTHPHILALHDSGEVDGRLFYAMPYVEGESLRQRLEREPQLRDLSLVEGLFGDRERARQFDRSAEALDSSWVDSYVNQLIAEGNTREAVVQAERLASVHPRVLGILEVAARASLAAGDYERARQHLDTIQRSGPDDWNWWGLTYRTSYGYALLKLGEREQGMRLLDSTLSDAQRLLKDGDERPGIQREIAAIHAAKGERQQAYDWLGRAIEAGWRLESVHPSPLFEPLRGEARFHELMSRIEMDIQRQKERVASDGLEARLEP